MPIDGVGRCATSQESGCPILGAGWERRLSVRCRQALAPPPAYSPPPAKLIRREDQGELMSPREPSNPVVGRLVTAINDGDRDALLATLSPDATLTDDGKPLSLTDSTARSSQSIVTSPLSVKTSKGSISSRSNATTLGERYRPRGDSR